MSQVTASFVSLLCSSSYMSQMVKNGWIHALDLAPFLHWMFFLKQSYLSGLGSGTESTLVCVSSWAQIRDLSCVNHFIVKPQIIENKRVFIGISKQGTSKRLYIYIYIYFFLKYMYIEASRALGTYTYDGQIRPILLQEYWSHCSHCCCYATCRWTNETYKPKSF